MVLNYIMTDLVIYYSLLGHNKELASEFAQKNNIDIIEFNPGTLFRVFQFFLRKKRLRKKAKELDIIKYDNLHIYGPIWAGKPAPAIMKLLNNIELKDKEVTCLFTFTQDYGNTENMIRSIIKTNGGIPKEISFQNISKDKKT